MSKKAKRILFYSGLGLDIAVTIFLFVIAIIMLATMPADKQGIDNANYINGPFIGYLQQHYTLYFWTCVFPLILLLIGNVVFLVLYVRKVAKKQEVVVDDLTDEQKAALRAELLKELQNEEKAADDSFKK